MSLSVDFRSAIHALNDALWSRMAIIASIVRVLDRRKKHQLYCHSALQYLLEMVDKYCPYFGIQDRQIGIYEWQKRKVKTTREIKIRANEPIAIALFHVL